MRLNSVGNLSWKTEEITINNDVTFLGGAATERGANIPFKKIRISIVLYDDSYTSLQYLKKK